MMRATIVVTVNYPDDQHLTGEDAEDDKAEFLHGVIKDYWPQVPVSNIEVNYTISEVPHEQHKS
jgi:hypothetical protein